MPTDTSHSPDVQRSTPRVFTLGEELMITGNVMAKGKLHLDGQVQGDIHCVSLVLGETSRLEGNVVAEDVVIGGRIKGSVRALRVTLQPKCYVECDLFHQSLTIEQGAYFEGKSRRVEDPLSGETAPQDRAGTKPQLVYERPEQPSDKPLRVTTRSLTDVG